jgi:uncharacterized protein (DUF427 family)
MSNQIQRQIPLQNQESVWDYPRPPHLESTSKLVRVEFSGVIIAESSRAMRVLETSHPPVYYIPLEDIQREYLSLTRHRTFCEFKGAASYWTLKVGEHISQNAAWSYDDPAPGYETLKNHLAFYPQRVDACYVNGEKVTPQEGDFYGGWITSDVVGPFKGAPGTWGW